MPSITKKRENVKKQITERDVIIEVMDKTTEYLEMCEPHNRPFAIIEVLARMLVKERQEKEFYKKIHGEKCVT